MSKLGPIFVVFGVSVWSLGLQAASAGESTPSFNRDILPLLTDNCFTCHGADAAQRKAKLRLETEDGAKMLLPSEGRAVVAGDRAASGLYQR